jgi:hypothetical protein
LSDRQLLDHWFALAGRHDAAAVRDCFSVVRGYAGEVVDRWANDGPVSAYLVVDIARTYRGCHWFGVSADFPNGNPYGLVQHPTRMSLFIGVGDDGGRPRILGGGTGIANETPGPTPYLGPPACP